MAWLLCAAVLATPAAQAQLDRKGPYAVVALGQTRYSFNDGSCAWFDDCARSNSTAFRLGGGYRFGVFALEAWFHDLGEADMHKGLGKLHERSLGVSAAWHLQLTPAMQGVLRTGLARVDDTRTNRTENGHWDVATFGLALVMDFTPSTAIELAWDSGSKILGGTTSAFTAGLRFRF
jgi:hypothetical protein